MNNNIKARLIAFYLPQFHPIPENDRWWGKGFTEWTNVAKMQPLFAGHYQPHVPANLGYYDLRQPEIRKAQAEMARKHGIEGFCYWHYWFNGKVLLERPVQEIIASREPDFPFCLAWANEPWSRRWTGRAQDVLQEQTYGGEDDDRRHFVSLIPALSDSRAIKIDGKPVFLIYKAKELPDSQRTTGLWRKLALENRLPGLYLISVETTGTFGWDPRAGGFDAAVEFQPNWDKCIRYTKRHWLSSIVNFIKYGMWIIDYKKAWPCLIADKADYPRYPGVFPRWDSTPRKGKKGLVLLNSTPDEYGKWLARAVESVQNKNAQHRIVFINAWNEWAEGNHLEPDLRFGNEYLDATLNAVKINRGEKL